MKGDKTKKKERENGWIEIKSKRHLSNNIVALLAILFMLTSVFFNWIIYKNTEAPFAAFKITGSALDTATIRFCLGKTPPNVYIIYPNGGEVVNGIIVVNASATKAEEDEDINVTFSYADFEHLIGTDADESDIYYNHSWDTTTAADGNCNYKIFAKAYSNNSVCEGIFGSDGSDSYFSINNIDVEPRWDNFKNNLTTNFSEFANPLILGDWTAIENATIGTPDKGLINFSDQTINFDDADLDSYINISYNYLSLNASISALPCLSRSAILTLYNLSFIQPIVLADGENCSSSQCTIINYSNHNLVFSVTDFNYIYSAAENATMRLEIWDQTEDTAKYVNQDIMFFANFSDSAYSNPINGTSVYCNIRFNLTGSYTSPADMNFNHSSLLYEYSRSFSSVGTFDYLVFCNASMFLLDSHYPLGTINKTNNFTITNRAPVLISNMPNETWNENTILTGRDLDDYFLEPDGETLTYTSTGVPNIDVSIDNITHVITYTPDANFYGNRTVKFYAYDPHNARAESNIVYLFVIHVPRPVPTPPSAGGGGGIRIICEELWECSEWSNCLPSGIEVRTCIDLADCGTEFQRPFESRECDYVATCDDLIKNCHVMPDGSILCEEGVDCGGPCPACAEIEIPAVIRRAVWPTILLIILLILAIVFVIVRYHKYYQPFIAKILMKFMPLAALFKKKKKIVPEELKVRESILARLDKLEKDIDKKSVEELSREFVRIIRDFLSSLLKIEYEFTHEELCKEIEKHKVSVALRIMLITFFKKISEVSYKGYRMKKKELRELINEARIIVKFGSEEYIEGKTEKREIKKKGLREKQKIKKESRLILEIYKDLIKAKNSIRESDIDSAKLAYIRVRELYKELPVKEKRKIYKRIVWLYDKIKEKELDKVKKT